MSSVTLALSVSDTQQGLAFRYNLKEYLISESKTYDNVKSVSLILTDIDTLTTDSDTHQQKYHPVYLDDDKILVPDNLLKQGDNYDALLQVRLDNNTILTAIIPETLYTVKPKTPIFIVTPNDNQITLTFIGLGNVDTGVDSFNGSSRINHVHIQYYNHADLSEIKAISLPLSSWPANNKSGNNWSYTITGLTNNVRYECQVFYENNTKNSDDSDAHMTPSEVPSPPSGLTVVPNDSGKLNLSWNKPSDALPTVGGYDVSNYWVYRKEGLNGTYSRIAVLGNVTSHEDSDGLKDGTVYYYKVRAALNVRIGQGESDVTNVDGNDTLTNDINVSDYSNEANCLCFDTSVVAPTWKAVPDNGKITLTLYDPVQTDNQGNNGTGKPFSGHNSGNGSDVDKYVVTYLIAGSTSTTLPLINRTGPVTTYVWSGLTNGSEIKLSVQYRQVYRGVNYDGASTADKYRTPFSTPAAVANFKSTPVDETSSDKVPLSDGDNGKLKLTWDHIDYDNNGAKHFSGQNVVNTGKWTDNINYRIYKGANVLKYNGVNYEGITDSSVVVEGFTLGEAQGLSVRAYYNNSELVEEDLTEEVTGNVSLTLSEHNVPFNYPLDVTSLTSTFADKAVTFSWVAGSGKGITPKFQTIFSGEYNSDQLAQSSPKTYNNLTNGRVQTVVVKTYTEYTARDNVTRKYYAKLSGSFTDGVSKKEIARKPCPKVTDLVVYPQKNQFLATFNAPNASDLGGAEFSGTDDFYLDHYRYSIQIFGTGVYVAGTSADGSEVSKIAERIFTTPLVDKQRYTLNVWAVTRVDGPFDVTTSSRYDGEVFSKDFSYFVNADGKDPNIDPLVVVPGDSKLDVIFAYNHPLDSSSKYDIRIYEDNAGLLTDIDTKYIGPVADNVNPDAAPVDGIVKRTITGLTNGKKYLVVVTISTLDSSANVVYDSESKYATPTDKVPNKVQNLVASNGDSNKTTITFTAPSNESSMPTGKTLVYQVVNKDEWDQLSAGNVNDNITSLTGFDVTNTNSTLSNNNVFTSIVRAYYVDNDGNRVYGEFSTVQSLPLPAPEKVSASSNPGDKQVVLTWTNVSPSDNVVFPKTELEIKFREIWPATGSLATLATIPASNGAISHTTFTHDVASDASIENGKKYEYVLVLKNNKSVLVTDVEAVNYGSGSTQLVASSDNATEELVTDSADSELTRPFAKPLVSDFNISGKTFSMKVSDNGRYIREVIIVGVPKDASNNVVKEIYVHEGDFVDNGSHPNVNSAITVTDKNDVRASHKYKIFNDITFDYDLKSIFYVIENIAGNTVGTYDNPN